MSQMNRRSPTPRINRRPRSSPTKRNAHRRILSPLATPIESHAASMIRATARSLEFCCSKETGMDDPHQAVPTPAENLVAAALNGELALPEFQRDFAWKPPQVRLLLASVALGWPIGSFMVWSAGRNQLQSKDFNGVKGVAALDDAEYLLDGQQRLTALIHAYHPEYSGYRYFIRDLVGFLESHPETEIEEHIDSLTVHQFTRKYPTLADQAREDIALISDIVDDLQFSRWEKAYNAQRESEEEKELLQLRAERLPGLRSYQIPCVKLGRHLELSAVARIFETTNRTGVKLGTVDLMTATLFPDFKLRDEWKEVVDRDASTWERFTNTVDAEDALRLISFWRTGGKSVTRDQILKMRSPDVIQYWNDAIAALSATMEFLRDECGVVQGSLLPQRLMVIPLAVAFERAGRSRNRRMTKNRIHKELQQWFWYAVSRGAFVRSTNTRAIRHAVAAKSFVEGENPSIRSALEADVGESADDLIERLLDSGRGERALEAAVLALVVAREGRDWRSGETPLKARAGAIEAHHIIPIKAPGLQDWKRVNCIANLTPQSRDSNRALSNAFPLDAGVKGEAAVSHFCDMLETAGRKPDELEEFVKRRAEKIRQAMEEWAGTPSLER